MAAEEKGVEIGNVEPPTNSTQHLANIQLEEDKEKEGCLPTANWADRAQGSPFVVVGWLRCCNKEETKSSTTKREKPCLVKENVTISFATD